MNWPPEGHVALWVVRAPSSPQAAHVSLLNNRERDALNRLTKPARQARYACAHALLRCGLANMLDCPPDALNFTTTKNRRPALNPHHADPIPPPDFNLSSTEGFVACAITRDGRIGVDIESGAPDLDLAALSARVLTPSEQHWVAGNKERFLRLWTLKEALSKADGEGLGLPFNQLLMLPDDSGGMEVDLTAWEGGSAPWQVLELKTEAPLALALRGPATPSRVTLEPPLKSDQFALFESVDVSVGSRYP